VRRPVRVVGLTGGIGAGKTEALRAFADAGAATLSSDDVVHALYRRDDLRAAVADRFGEGVIGPDGQVDRSAVGARVFADPAERRWLEALLLPMLLSEFERWRAGELAAGTRLLVHEAPTLFEAGVQDRYDAIVTVTAPEPVREARRPGAAARMAHQLPEADKVARSDFVYRNDGDLAQLRSWVTRLAARLAAT
jgi:dephospho-CoA kinase